MPYPINPNVFEIIGTCLENGHVEYDREESTGLRIIRQDGIVYRMFAAVAEAIHNAPPSPISRIRGIRGEDVKE